MQTPSMSALCGVSTSVKTGQGALISLSPINQQLMFDQRSDDIFIAFVKNPHDVFHGKILVGEEVTDRDFALVLRIQV